MRMRNVSHMNNNVCEVNLVEGCLEALNKSVRQVGDEPDRIKQNRILSIWQSKSSVGSVKSLEQFILTFKFTACAQVRQCTFACVGVPYQTNERCSLMVSLSFFRDCWFFNLMGLQWFHELGLSEFDVVLFHLQLSFSRSSLLIAATCFGWLYFQLDMLLTHQIPSKHPLNNTKTRWVTSL